MRKADFAQLVAGTADAAYVVDSEGLVIAWNEAAEALFGIAASEAIGRPCHVIVQGVDECGPVCSRHCTIQQAVGRRRPLANFDLQVKTVDGERWCNVSVLIGESNTSTEAYAIHIVRPVDLPKRLEIMMQDFVVTNMNVSAEQAVAMIASRKPARGTDLSDREIEILRLLGSGSTTQGVADQLHISRTTVNNHIQHITHKLNVHTRLEAIRRAEHAGLI